MFDCNSIEAENSVEGIMYVLSLYHPDHVFT